jgi:ATP-dependent DNA helicase PIF1
MFGATVWSASQQRALAAVLQRGKNTFITGAGGVGKTQVIKHVVAYMRERNLKVAVTAHTGIAAVSVGGMTLMSWARLYPSLLKQPVDAIVDTLRKRKCSAYFGAFRMLIIDEISMVEPDFFELLDVLLQRLRGTSRPFGGLQLVLCGDFFQLPPIESSGRLRRFVFQTDSFFAAIDEMVDMKEMWRQRDPVFVQLLHRVRRGEQTADDLQLLQARVGAPLACEQGSDPAKRIMPTVLYGRNAPVDDENDSQLAALPGRAVSYATRSGVYKSFRAGKRADDASRLEKLHCKLLTDMHFAVPPPRGGGAWVQPALGDLRMREVELRVGAQVLLSYNLDVAGGLVNGSRGVVTGFGETNAERAAVGKPLRTTDPESSFALKAPDDNMLYPDEPLPIVRFRNGRVIEVPYVRWTLESPEGAEAYAWRIALKLAWATTVHKAQSLTLDALEVDLSTTFGAGMAYVALSRATEIENLRIKAGSDVRAAYFSVDPAVLEFYAAPFVVHKAQWAARQREALAATEEKKVESETSGAAVSPSTWKAPQLASEADVLAMFQRTT